VTTRSNSSPNIESDRIFHLLSVSSLTAELSGRADAWLMYSLSHLDLKNERNC